MAEKAKYIDVKELSIILDIMKNPDSEFATDDYIDGFSDGISAAIKELEAFPTADVVEVVRCKDCKHLLQDLSEREAHLCMRNGLERVGVNLDDFCSYGERKETDNG